LSHLSRLVQSVATRLEGGMKAAKRFPNTLKEEHENKLVPLENSGCWVLAGAGGIEPPNGGIKISLIIQLFQSAFGKKAEKAL
jgi:hypothetical protein